MHGGLLGIAFCPSVCLSVCQSVRPCQILEKSQWKKFTKRSKVKRARSKVTRGQGQMPGVKGQGQVALFSFCSIKSLITSQIHSFDEVKFEAACMLAQLYERMVS